VSVLAMLQVICAQLYQMARGRPDRVVRPDDLRTPGDRPVIRLDLPGYADDLIRRALAAGPSRDRKALWRMLEDLQFPQPEGSARRDLTPEEEAARRGRGVPPRETVLGPTTARDVRLLEENWLNIAGGEGRYVSLGHDVLAPAAARQAELDTRRQVGRSR